MYYIKVKSEGKYQGVYINYEEQLIELPNRKIYFTMFKTKERALLIASKLFTDFKIVKF